MKRPLRWFMSPSMTVSSALQQAVRAPCGFARQGRVSVDARQWVFYAVALGAQQDVEVVCDSPSGKGALSWVLAKATSTNRNN